MNTHAISVDGNLADPNTGDAKVIPFKVYSALLSQAGEGAPTVDVLQNTIGPIVWSRITPGAYKATLANAFTSNRTAIIISSPGYFVTGGSIVESDDDYILIQATDPTDGSDADGAFNKTYIEIRVYDPA